jgi:membrane associated rhomboid family serine protease
MLVVFGDNLHRKRIAVATYIFAGLCVAASLVEAADPNVYAQIVERLAFVPIDFSLHPVTSLYTLFTAQLLHSGIAHLVGNLIFLIAFGRSIENLVGSVAFAAAFGGLGALSFLGSWLITPASHVPIIGASGALSFLMGAYTIVCPAAKQRISPFLRVPSFPAWASSAGWTALQVLGALSIGESVGGVAYATHLAGFAVGLIAGMAWKEFALDTDRLIAELTDEVSS